MLHFKRKISYFMQLTQVDLHGEGPELIIVNNFIIYQ
jgi:hypothetical protein